MTNASLSWLATVKEQLAAQKQNDPRLAALWRFATAITLLNVFGHTYLGFEQSWAQPLVGLVTAYALEFLLETLSAWGERRPLRYAGGRSNLLSFALPAHITGLAVPMLLYTNNLLWPIVMAVAIAIGSKYIFRVQVGKGTRHFFNPSNTGIGVTLLIFPWVGIAPPYHFTENLFGLWNWVLVAVIITAGSYLNWGFTGRMPLILAWVGAFAAQAVVRSLVTGLSITATLLPMTGLAFLLFTFYMVSDPGTTPFDRRGQIVFGASVGLVYGLLVTLHIVFGIFFALLVVCTVRGAWLYAQSLIRRRARVSQPALQPATPGGTTQ